MKRLDKNTFYALIPVSIFKCGVLMVYTKGFSRLEDIFRRISEKEGMSGTENAVKTLQERDVEIDDATAGYCFKLNNGGDVLVAVDREDFDAYVLIHELTHAMQYICRSKGIDDIETEAYLMEYLCREAIEDYYEFKARDKAKQVAVKHKFGEQFCTINAA